MRAWAQVQVRNPDHPRVGQAGVTTSQTPDNAEAVEVRFDLPDQAGATLETVQVVDLQVLAS